MLLEEQYYRSLSRIHTPIGEWGILGSSSGEWDKLKEEVIGKFGLTLDREKVENRGGCFGPYWNIDDPGSGDSCTSRTSSNFRSYLK